MPDEKHIKIGSLLSRWVFLLCCVLGISGGVLLVNSEIERVEANNKALVTHLGAYYYNNTKRIIQKKKMVGKAANEAVLKGLTRSQPGSAVDVKKIPRGRDGAFRSLDQGSGAFASNAARMSPELAEIFHRTRLMWRFLSGVVRENFSNFWMISSEGVIRISPPDWAFDVEPDHRFFENIYYTVATPENNPGRGAVWTPVYYDSVLKQWMISLIIPLYDGDRFLGVTGSDLPITELLDDLSIVNRAETGLKIFIFDKNNNIIMHPAYMDTILSQTGEMSSLIDSESIANPDLKTFIHDFNDGNLGYGKLIHYRDGGQAMEGIAFELTSFLNWRLVAYKSRKPLDEQIYRLRIKAMLLTMAVALVLAFFIRLIADKLMIRRINALAAAAEAFEEGKAYDFSPGRRDEIGFLAHAFNKMSDTIGRQISEFKSENTNRQAAEASLEKLRNYLASIIDSMPSVLVGIDEQTRVTLWNSTAEKSTGIGGETAKGHSLFEVLPQLASRRTEIVESLENHKIITGLKIQRAVEDSTRYEDMTIYPLRTHGMSGAVIRIDDVTKQTLIEQQLVQSRKMDAIGQLAGGVAHDFNNMLAAIIGSVEVLRLNKDQYTEKDLKLLDSIFKAGLRASGLTKKLLTFSRKGELAFATVDIHSIIGDTVDLLNRTVDKKITISVEYQADSCWVEGDDSSLQNAFMNICINASQAMPDGGYIQIKTRNLRLEPSYCQASPFDIQPGEFVEAEFSDSGVGIPLENLKRIFEPFFTTKERGQGTGLGLAAVYGIIQDHHGALSVYSEVGQGAKFKVYLPCSIQEGQDKEASVQVVQGSGTILLVDDEPFIHDVGRMMLESMGYTVIVAENGEAAVSVFEKKHSEIDLVITDMIMPRMDGKETFKQMRKIDPDAKIVVSSGFPKKEIIDELLSNGLCGFIRKPFRDYELSTLISNILSR